MKNFFSFGSLFKKSIPVFLITVSVLASFSGAANAEKWTTYLAPQYNDIPFKAENAFVSVIPDIDQTTQQPNFITVTDENELLEVARTNAFKVLSFPGAGEYAADVIPSLQKSAEMIDSAKLRVIARMKKLDLIIKSGNSSYAEFYKKYVSSPIAMFVGINLGTGPACGQIPLFLSMKDGSLFFFNTVMIIEDIPNAFSIVDAIKNDTFDLVVAHENAHGIMYDMYGSQMQVVKKVSNVGHDGPVISDRGLAFIEGWAEAFEALYGPTNPLLKLKEEEREKYRISEFLFTRQDPVRRDRYIWQAYKGKKTGLLKNGLQIISTEGVVAGQFYDIMTSKALKDPFIKSIAVMYNHRPKDYIEFLKGWVQDNPQDKQTLYRIFLEETKYVTVSNEARALYFDYYQAKLKYVQKQLEESKFYEIKKKWEAYKEDLFKKVMQSDNLTSNIGPDLWMNVTNTNLEKATNIRVNLSIYSAGLMTKVIRGITAEDVDAIIKARDALGVLPYKTATEALTEILGAEKANKIITEAGITNM